MDCKHNYILLGCSPGAAGSYRQPLLQKRLAVTTESGRVSKNQEFVVSKVLMDDEWTFPAPLVLPGDDLDGETIYVIGQPEVTAEVKSMMKGWEKPVVPTEYALDGIPSRISPLKLDDLCEYLTAFYHTMNVAQLDGKCKWRLWDDKRPSEERGYIGLETPQPSRELVGVRYRPSLDGVAKGQVNQADILDAMLYMIPEDAYAIVMVTNLDLYEDEDDDFCCGRAYGGSRIAIVSSFRYNPVLDGQSNIDVSHMWPASHCKSYIKELYREENRAPQRSQANGKGDLDTDSPLGAAFLAAESCLAPKTKREYEGLWFSRAARTISHEVGHCLILGHCSYYACSMQGSSCISEDVRQPPYLCSICLSKVSRGLYSFMGQQEDGVMGAQRAYIVERYQALLVFCEKWEHVGMFAGYHAWISKRLEESKASDATA